jgi:hypothetical protein
MKDTREQLEAIELKLKDLTLITENLNRSINSLCYLQPTVKEQKAYLSEIKNDIHILQEQQKGINMQLGQALNTLIVQSKAPAILQIGLFAMIFVMFAIYVLGWRVGGNFKGVKFENAVTESK